MKEIDINNWKRKEHFNLFRAMDLPFYNTNLNLDITGLREYTKDNRLGFNNTLVYLVIDTINKIENFKYRIVNDKVILFDTIHPAFTHLKPNDDLFSLIVGEYEEDLFKFDKNLNIKKESCNYYFNLEDFSKGNNLAIMSPQSWFSFTGVDHTLSFNKDDAIPKISWGKFFTDGDRIKLPFNIQVNHIFIDGYHIGKLVESLQKRIYELIKLG